MSSSPSPLRQPDMKLFFPAIAIFMAVSVFVGFAPSYFFRAGSDLPALRPSLHVHGLLFSAWMALFIVQAALIRVHKPLLHRQLGYFGAGLAALMVIAGIVVGLESMRISPDPLASAVVSFGDMVVFAPLVAAAITLRKRTDVHKRLMVCATVAIIDAGVGRWPVVSDLVVADIRAPSALLLMWFLTDIPLFAVAIYDKTKLGVVHTATLWGGSAVVLSQLVKLLILQF